MNAQGHQKLAQPAVLDVEAGIHQSRNGRWQCKREVDQGIDYPPQGKLVANEHPRHERTKSHAQQRRRKRCPKRERVGRNSTARRNGRPEFAWAQRCDLQEARRQGYEQQHAEVQQREAQAQAKSG